MSAPAEETRPAANGHANGFAPPRPGGPAGDGYPKPSSRVAFERDEGDYVLTLGEFLRVVRGRAWFILTVVLLSLAAAGLLVAFQPPTYEASVKILIGQEEGTSSSGNLGGDVQGLQDLTQTMAEAVANRPLAEVVVDRLDLPTTPEDFLEDHLTVEQVSETQFLLIHYRSSDPVEAQQAANAVGERFSERVAGASPSANAVTATIWEPAVVPEDPVSPDSALYAAAGIALGLLLGVGLAFGLEQLDRGWKSPEEVEGYAGLPVFGAIPRFESKKKGGR